MKTYTIRSAGRLLALCVLMLLPTGCGSFDRHWDSLEDVPAPIAGMEGRWKGTWHSESTDHTGDLRAIIERNESGDLQARFHATYAMGLTFEHTMAMTDIERRDDVWHFSGEADLGLLAGGVYQHEGTVDGDVYFSTYTSKGDTGTFEMTRVPERNGGADDDLSEE